MQICAPYAKIGQKAKENPGRRDGRDFLRNFFGRQRRAKRDAAFGSGRAEGTKNRERKTAGGETRPLLGAGQIYPSHAYPSYFSSTAQRTRLSASFARRYRESSSFTSSGRVPFSNGLLVSPKR